MSRRKPDFPESQRKRPHVPHVTISAEAEEILRSKQPMGPWLDKAILEQEARERHQAKRR